MEKNNINTHLQARFYYKKIFVSILLLMQCLASRWQHYVTVMINKLTGGSTVWQWFYCLPLFATGGHHMDVLKNLKMHMHEFDITQIVKDGIIN